MHANKGPGLKLSINLELPKEPEYKPSIEEKVEELMERVEFNDDTEAYHYLRKLITCATRCYNQGKRGDKLHAVLSMLTPFMAQHALHDIRGVELVDGFVTNPDYEKEPEDEC